MTGAAFGDFYATYNIAWIASFLLAAVIAGLLNWPVRNVFIMQLGRAADEISSKTRKPKPEVLKDLENHFDLPTASLIGKLERILYVFGIMFGGAFAIISGWLVLKAFNTWLEVFEQTQPGPLGTSQNAAGKAAEQQAANDKKLSRMIYYHLYLVGNAMSLMMGITLGFLGLQLAAHGPTFLAWLCK